MSKVEKFLQSAFFRTLISIVVGFAVGAVFLAAVQINVGAAYGKLFTSIFANAKSLSYSVVYATPLIILGLSVAFSFRTGVFNIGAEGQFVVGSMAACVVGILVPAPAIVLVPLCVLVSAVAGAVWGMIVGILKVKWGINEVLSMIMFSLDPAFLAVTLAAAWTWSFILSGKKGLKFNLMMTVPVLIIMSVVNTLFTHNGKLACS